MTRAFLLLALLWAAPVSAQHLCDRPEVSTATVPEGAVTVSVCYPGLTLPSASVQVGAAVLTPIFSTDGTMNASGLREFHGTITLAPGAAPASMLVNGRRTPLQTLIVTARPLPPSPLPSAACVVERKVVKLSSTSVPTLEGILNNALYADRWAAKTSVTISSGNVFLILERCK